MPSSAGQTSALRSEEHTSELHSHSPLVCRLLLVTNSDARGQGPLSRAEGHARRPAARARPLYLSFVFFFNDTATTEIYTLSLHDALPIYSSHTLISYAVFCLRDESVTG